jgi:hypothetical protein
MLVATLCNLEMFLNFKYKEIPGSKKANQKARISMAL